mgnify:CR=1 FL=1
MDRLIKSNLELMRSNSFGGMASLSSSESMGATGGTWKGMSCMTANFFYDDDGKIIEFSNQISAKDGEKDINFGSFKIAMDIKNKRFGIVLVIVDANSSKTAQVKLVDSAKAYNQQVNWPIEVKLDYLGKFLGQK